MAAALWELPGGGDEAVTAFLEERATIGAVTADDAKAGPGAHAYRSGTLEPAAWIEVAPGEPGPSWPLLPTALALLGLSLMSAWAFARRRSPPPPRYPAPPALLATLLLAATAVAATAWAHRALGDLSSERAAQGARAVEVAVAHGADPAHAPRVAGLPWATTRSLERPDELWTMPRDVAEAVAAAPPPTTPSYTVTANGATYHVTRTAIPTPTNPTPPVPQDPTTSDTTTRSLLHLVFLGYEETPLTSHRPGRGGRRLRTCHRTGPLPPPPLRPPPRPAAHPRRVGLSRSGHDSAAPLHLRPPALLALDLAARLAPR